MSLSKAMSFEATPLTKPSVKSVKKAANTELDRRSGWAILGYLVLRYRHGLVRTWAIVITTLYFFPFTPELVYSGLQSLFAGH